MVQEVCIARGKAQGALGKTGLRPPPQLEPGTAEALLCSGALARSIGSSWEPHVRVLLPSLFAGGLSAPLVVALEAIAEALPTLVPQVLNPKPSTLNPKP